MKSQSLNHLAIFTTTALALFAAACGGASQGQGQGTAQAGANEDLPVTLYFPQSIQGNADPGSDKLGCGGASQTGIATTYDDQWVLNGHVGNDALSKVMAVFAPNGFEILDNSTADDTGQVTFTINILGTYNPQVVQAMGIQTASNGSLTLTVPGADPFVQMMGIVSEHGFIVAGTKVSAADGDPNEAVGAPQVGDPLAIWVQFTPDAPLYDNVYRDSILDDLYNSHVFVGNYCAALPGPSQ